MRFLGIDPGLSGACAALDIGADGSEVVTVHPVPVEWVPVGKGRRRVYDVGLLWQTIRGLQPIGLAYLEAQGARPGQGVSSTFSIGQGYGMWHALLVAAGIPFSVVSAQHWRNQVGLRHHPTTKARKKEVRLIACRRFPGAVIPLDHADAVMMAYAAALYYGVHAREQHVAER